MKYYATSYCWQLRRAAHYLSKTSTTLPSDKQTKDGQSSGLLRRLRRGRRGSSAWSALAAVSWRGLHPQLKMTTQLVRGREGEGRALFPPGSSPRSCRHAAQRTSREGERQSRLRSSVMTPLTAAESPSTATTRTQARRAASPRLRCSGAAPYDSRHPL